jgi:predicted dehydrogenase
LYFSKKQASSSQNIRPVPVSRMNVLQNIGFRVIILMISLPLVVVCLAPFIKGWPYAPAFTLDHFGRMLHAGKLGRLINVTALWQLQKPDSYFETAWRREPGAGFLLTNLIHDLDLLRHLCGEVVQVQAFTRNDVRGFANEDSAAVLLQFANGALGSLTGSDAVAAPWSWELDAGESPVYPRQDGQPCYLLAGTQGALSIPQLKRWHYAEAGSGWHTPLLQSEESIPAGEALTLQLQHFVRVARGEQAPLIDAADGGRTLALIEAIRQAAETGRACAPEHIA